MDKQKNKYYYLKGIKNGMLICLDIWQFPLHWESLPAMPV